MTDAGHPALEPALEVASAALGATLTQSAPPISDGSRAAVVRARRPDTVETVIVKAYRGEGADEAWARETAALTTLAGLGPHAPALLAAVASPPVVVMEDLGPGESLATALLGRDPRAAGRVVVDWAETLADLHAATWNNVGGFVAALQTASGSTGPVDPAGLPRLLEDGWARLREAVDELGVRADEQVRAEITRLAELGEIQVVSPTDACPDNNVSTVDGLRLIDFERASVMHPAWDIAYLHVPWPSCWCAWQLPADVSELAHRAWLNRLSTRLADRDLTLDEPAMDAAIRRAGLVWCLITIGWFLPRAVAGRRSAGPRAPELTSVIQHRLQLITAAELPGISATQVLARRLLAVLAARWPAVALPLAPAFRGR